MTEEIQEKKNTVATVGMRFSIIWLIALITLFLAWLWLPLLVLWFILWIIGLFYKPRGKARVAICIPLIVFIIIFWTIAYIWSSAKTPAIEFIDRAKNQLEQVDEKTFDGDKFGNMVENEVNYIINDKTEDDWKTSFDASTWSNVIEKGSYLIFSILQQWFENALEKYNNGELAEISDDDDNKIVTIDIDVEDDEDAEKDIEEDSEETENTKQENVEVFTQSEQNDIEQILNILE
jgi:hypothetical protein